MLFGVPAHHVTLSQLSHLVAVFTPLLSRTAYSNGSNIGANPGCQRSAFCKMSGAVDKWFIVLVDTFGIRTEFDLLLFLCGEHT